MFIGYVMLALYFIRLKCNDAPGERRNCMRKIEVSEIRAAIISLIETASFDLGERELAALKKAKEVEGNGSTAESILEKLLENAEIAKAERRPLCQDTGVAVFFLRLVRICTSQAEISRELLMLQLQKVTKGFF